MKRLALGVMLAMAAGAATAAPKIVEADWVTKPSGADIDAYFPSAAVAANIGGKVMLRCLVTREGKPTRCRVTEETPKAMGFGKAAAAMIEAKGLFSPRRVNGRAVADWISVPVAFTPFSGRMTRSDWLPSGRAPLDCLGLALDDIATTKRPQLIQLVGLFYHRVALDYLTAGQSNEALLEAVTDARNRAARLRDSEDLNERRATCLSLVQGATRTVRPGTPPEIKR